jgi:hypothetical protein
MLSCLLACLFDVITNPMLQKSPDFVQKESSPILARKRNGHYGKPGKKPNKQNAIS